MYSVRWQTKTGGDIQNESKNFVKTATDGWNNSGATSYSILEQGEDGQIDIIITNVNSVYSVGLSSSKNPDGDPMTFEFALYFDGGTLNIYENGSSQGISQSYSIGDVFSISVTASNIDYLKNNSSIHTTSNNITNDLYAATAIYTYGFELTSTEYTFGRPYLSSVDLVLPEYAVRTGSIIFDVDSEFPPYTYKWDEFNYIDSILVDTIIIDTSNYALDTIVIKKPTDSLLFLKSGNYTVTITDANQRETIKEFSLSDKLNLSTSDSIDFDTLTNSITSTRSNSNWGPSTLKLGTKVNYLSNFELSFNVDPGSEILLGLRDTIDDPVDTLLEFAYAIHIDNQGAIHFHEGQSIDPNIGSYNQDARYSIQIIDEDLLIFEDDNQLHTTTLSQSSEYFVEGLTIGSSGISNIVQIGGGDLYVPQVDIQHSSCLVDNGSIVFKDIANFNGYAHLNDESGFHWYLIEDNSETLITRNSSLLGIGAGIYKLVVNIPVIGTTSSSGFITRTFYYRVGNKVIWNYKDPDLYWTGGKNAQNLDLTTSNSVTTAISLNYCLPLEDVWVALNYPAEKSSFFCCNGWPASTDQNNKIEFGLTESTSKVGLIPNFKFAQGAAFNCHKPNTNIGYSNSRYHVIYGLFNFSSFHCIPPGNLLIERKYSNNSYEFSNAYETSNLANGTNVLNTFTSSVSSGLINTNYSTTIPDGTNYLYLKLTEPGSEVRNLVTSMGCHFTNSYNVVTPELESDFRNTLFDHLFFQYTGEYNKGKLNFNLYDIHNVEQTSFNLNYNMKDNGDNRYILDLSSLQNGYYILKVTNEKNEDYFLRINKEL